jgi:crossover junction endodeoxyribonuclease RuvC
MKISDKKLLEIFEKCSSITETARKAKVSYSTAHRKLKKLGKTKKKIIYTCNNNFFSEDSMESFYWAGFIAADGNLFLKEKKYKQLRIELSSIDDDHLLKFKKNINYSGNINYNIKKSSCNLTIRSDEIFDDLKRFNIIPNKTLTYSIPQWMIDHPLSNHFIRGLVDGDGSFYYKKAKDRKIHQLSFNITGTKNTIDTIKDILVKNCNIKENKTHKIPKSKSYKLEYSGNECVLDIRQFLYRDAKKSCYLDRKYNKVSKNPNYILGLDLSMNSTGFCLLENGKIVNNDAYGLIQPNPKDCQGKKLSLIEKNIKAIIREYRPGKIVIEEIFRGRNILTFKYLAMVRGVVLKLLFEEGFEDRLSLYTALQARKIIGSGKSKEETFDFVTQKYNLNFFNFDDHNDIIDAMVLSLAETSNYAKSL